MMENIMSAESEVAEQDKNGFTRREVLLPLAIMSVSLLASCTSPLLRSKPSWEVNYNDEEILSLLEQGEQRARAHYHLVGDSFQYAFGQRPQVDIVATIPEDPDPEVSRLMGVKFYQTETDLLLDLDKKLHIFPRYIEHYDDEQSIAIFYHLLGMAVAGRNSIVLEDQSSDIVGFTRRGVDLEGMPINIANGAEHSDLDLSMSTGTAFLLGDFALFRKTGESLFPLYPASIEIYVREKIVGHSLITLELLSNYRENMKLNVDQAFFHLYELFSNGDPVGFVRGVIGLEPTLEDIENVEMLYRKRNNLDYPNTEFIPKLMEVFRKEYGLPPATFNDYREYGDIARNSSGREESTREWFLRTSKVL